MSDYFGAPDFVSVQSFDTTKTVGIGAFNEDGSQAFRIAVGEWFVHNHHEASPIANDIKIAEVQWVYEAIETAGYSYDLSIVTETKEIWYVEVKATSSMNKELIPISWRELKFAEQVRQRFFLYRLYNIGKSTNVLTHMRITRKEVIPIVQAINMQVHTRPSAR